MGTGAIQLGRPSYEQECLSIVGARTDIAPRDNPERTRVCAHILNLKHWSNRISALDAATVRPMSAQIPFFSPPSAPLSVVRQQQIDAARHRFVEQGVAAGPVWSTPWLDRSWRRCLERGRRPLDPVAFEAVSQAAITHALEGSQPLLRAALPVIRSLARAMADTRYFAVLTNAEGIVIDVNGPVDRHDRRATDIARIGVDLSEAAVGTTAIGAALTELEPVWLHRGEHFFQSNAIYSCAGAPVFGPQGQCLGMLDLTGIDAPEQPALKHLVAQSARSIGNALALAQPHALLLRLNWPGQILGSDADGLVCLDAEGHITAANHAATEMLALDARWQRLHGAEVFASPWENLYDLARSPTRQTELPLWSGLRLQVMATRDTPSQATRHPAPSLPLKEVETAFIRKAVQDAGGNVMEASKALGISRATIYRKLNPRRN